MARPGFRRQLDTLIERNISILLGSPGTLLLLFAQAPIIGYFIGLAWRGQEASPQTYFIMSVAALWMGCMNACTAIVSERAVYTRERMFRLDIRSYLFSKMAVLSVMCGLQTLLLLLAQGKLMHLRDSITAHILIFAVMTLTGVAAAALGLLISSVARTAYAAVVSVPILLIPQVIFSEVLLQANIRNSVPAAIEKATLTKWCYEALIDVHKDIEWLVQLKSLAALALALTVFLALAALKLKADEA